MNAPATITEQPLCDLSLHTVTRDPCDHILRDGFIDPHHYTSICQSFPTCPVKIGPTGYSLYWGDDSYDKLLESEPAWRALFQTFHSQRFIEWCRDQFSEVWEREGCLLDLSTARYVPYRED